MSVSAGGQGGVRGDAHHPQGPDRVLEHARGRVLREAQRCVSLIHSSTPLTFHSRSSPLRSPTVRSPIHMVGHPSSHTATWQQSTCTLPVDAVPSTPHLIPCDTMTAASYPTVSAPPCLCHCRQARDQVHAVAQDVDLPARLRRGGVRLRPGANQGPTSSSHFPSRSPARTHTRQT